MKEAQAQRKASAADKTNYGPYTWERIHARFVRKYKDIECNHENIRLGKHELAQKSTGKTFIYWSVEDKKVVQDTLAAANRSPVSGDLYKKFGRDRS